MIDRETYNLLILIVLFKLPAILISALIFVLLPKINFLLEMMGKISLIKEKKPWNKLVTQVLHFKHQHSRMK